MEEYISVEELEALGDLQAIEVARKSLEHSKKAPDSQGKYEELYIWQYYLKTRFNGPLGEYREHAGEAMALYSDFVAERKRIFAVLEEKDRKKGNP